MKVFQAAFLYFHCRFVLFWRKEIGIKDARKMLVKLTEEGKSQKFWKNKRLVLPLLLRQSKHNAVGDASGSTLPNNLRHLQCVKQTHSEKDVILYLNI